MHGDHPLTCLRKLQLGTDDRNFRQVTIDPESFIQYLAHSERASCTSYFLNFMGNVTKLDFIQA